jgi:hypothetical protein
MSNVVTTGGASAGANGPLSAAESYGTFAEVVTANAGTSTAGSAPVLTPAFAASTVAIGPTSTPANTILPSSSVVAGQLISFRLPAGWYVKWAGTTTAIATQTAIGC